ncbi:MAG: ribonuclease HII [Flavobacterium sp.]|jgi:ribonuclease HII|uniref:ribonuclease HII n=1 Tax=Flavobacterium sp. TaxID=239 RepID=UPI0022CB0CE6|nr:ribonuclease HII [Flavobacterium sp.]MCZ8169412.1 ribonuclease HII [Flavobacterium sp.]MCZ8295835.1 ribonuclease HII [Flavobacterium sp.]
MLAKQFSNYVLECGTDEAGRGCLAGPVTAAAVILPHDFENALLNDSKKLTEKQRTALAPIIEKEAISFHVVHLEPKIIDEINILNASIKAMQESILQLMPQPEFIIVDGNRFKPVANIPFQTIIKGDGKYLSIAAASILAKTYRDTYMERIHEAYPMYQWNKNKGYPTQDHRDAIREFGITPYHRKSFRLLPDQLTLDFDF